ncbi:hypothetical protein AAC387_Pa01g2437 [Persea americana]
MGNEMGNSNVSGVHEQDNNELQVPNKSSEASMELNVADGVEAKLPDLPSEAEDFHEKLDESASVNQPEMGDQQIQEQTSTERENENVNLQSPNECFEALMPSNGEDGDDKNSSTLMPEEEDFPEKPVKPSEIDAIDEKKLSALQSEAEDFHEKPVEPSEIGDLQIENQTSTEDKEIKTSKQTSTNYELISTESVNQKHNEQESIDSSNRSCMENSNHDNVIGSDGSCDSNQKGDTREIISEYIDPHSDLEVEKNVEDMLIEETEKHKSKLLEKICISRECDENLVELERGYGLSRVSIVQSAGLENRDEQQSKLNSDRNDSTKLPSIISFDSYQEANDSEIKRVCLEDHAEVIENGYKTNYNDNQDPIVIPEECKEYIDESKTNENGEGTDRGDKKTDSDDGFCSSGIGRGAEVDKENENESKFEIESHNSSPSLDLEEHSKYLETVQESIDVATSLTEYKDRDTTHEEITEVVDDESFKQSKLLKSGKAEGMAIPNNPLPFSDSIQKYVDVIEQMTRKKEDSESFNERVGERTEQLDRESDTQLKEDDLYATSITEKQRGSIEDVVQPILKQSDLSQNDTVMEGKMEEPIIPQSDRTEQEMVVEGENEEPILDRSDPILQEMTLVQAYSVDHSQEPEKELILLESKRSITDSDEENYTKVDQAKKSDANSSNPMVNTSASPPESEDPTAQVIKVVGILSCQSGELFVLPTHKTDEQEQKSGLMAYEGAHDSNMDSEMLENSDTFSFEFENPFAEAQVLALQSQKEEFEQNPSLHLQTETVKGVASASERGHSESDRKNHNIPAEVIKTDVLTLEVKIEESEKHPLLQQPNENFHFELENPIAKNRISGLKTSKEEPTETTMLLLKTSAGSEVLSSERSDLRKFRTPIQRILKEETCVLESLQKQESTVLKETVDEAWKAPNEVTSTSPGERKKHKPRYSLFGNCMCCTTVQ